MNYNDEKLAKSELDRALREGDHEEIARTIISNIWPLYSSHYNALTSAVTALPSDVVERYILLRMLHPMTPILARTTRPFKPLVLSDDAKVLTPEELDFVTAAQMIAFRTSGDVASAILYAKRLEDRIVMTRVESRDRTDGPLWYLHHQIGSTLLAAGDMVNALLSFGTSRQLAEISMQTDGMRMALGRTALAHVMRGSHREAVSALAEAVAQPLATAAHATTCRTTEAVTAALIATESMTDDLDDELARLEAYDSWELTWSFALLARTRAAIARHHPEEAVEMARLARDAHRVQDGTFAADVIASAITEALTFMGDIAGARRVTRTVCAPGVLSRLASARLSLRESDLDAAAMKIEQLRKDAALGPAQHAELQLLTAWLHFAQSNDVDETTAAHVRRIGAKRENRRLLATMPRQLIERVRERVACEALDDTLSGLVLVKMRQRPQLTRSEVRVLKALSVYETTASIAAALHVSPNTIKSQLQSVYRKLGCSTRGEAVRAAFRLRLAPAGPTPLLETAQIGA